MDEEAEAEAWVRRKLDVTREIFRTHPRGPRDLTLEQYEQQLRQKADVCLRPTTPYVGLTLDAAEALANLKGDWLCVHRGQTPHRADWTAYRVHVDLDATEQVLSAWRDAAPWRRRG